MSSNSISHDVVQAEHVRTTFQQFPVAILTHTLDGAVLVAMLWGLTETPALPLVLWLGAILALGLVRWLAMRRYFRSGSQLSRWRSWAAVAVAFSAGFGILWAAAVVLFMDFATPASVILLVVFPIGLAAGAAATHAALLVVFLAFLLTLVPTLAAVLIAEGTLFGLAFGVLAIAMLVVDSAICLNLHKALDEAQRLRFELEDARAQTEQANRAKTRFLAAASHDLRQPIHALGLFFASLKARVRDAGAAPLMTRVEETIGVISDMLNALLDISKLDAGIVEPTPGARAWARDRPAAGCAARP